MTHSKEAASPRGKRVWWPLIPAALALGVLVYAAIPPPLPEPAVLKGRWVRQDGDKFINVKGIAPGGSAEVEYFNPNPIHVETARTVQEEGKLGLRVELRDENYPGCVYTLAYDPRNDRLEGEYYQAGQRATYPVSFTREK